MANDPGDQAAGTTKAINMTKLAGSPFAGRFRMGLLI